METLYIDVHEPATLKAALKETVYSRSSDLKLEEEGLKTGDYVLNDVVIERKEANDYASSITTGRLSDQSSRMAADYTHKYLILEGYPYNLEHTAISDNSLTGMAVSLAAKKDVKIVPTSDQESTAYAIWKIMQTHVDGEGFDPEEVLLKRTKADTEDVFVAMISCIEGISQEKAEEISNQFRNMAHLAGYIETDRAKVKEDLTLIDGIGDVLAERIIQSLI